MTALGIVVGVLLSGLFFGYHLHREHQRRADAAHENRTLRADLADAKAERDEAVTCFNRLEKVHADAVADVEWLRLVNLDVSIGRTKAETERNTYRTAFTAVMLNQVNAELLKPEAPAGVADVIEFPTRAGGAR